MTQLRDRHSANGRESIFEEFFEIIFNRLNNFWYFGKLLTMWFHKWFRRNKDEDAYEPAAHAPHPAQASLSAQEKSGQGKPADRQMASMSRVGAARNGAKPDDGFDPYNSSAFDRHNAWERITRR